MIFSVFVAHSLCDRGVSDGEPGGRAAGTRNRVDKVISGEIMLMQVTSGRKFASTAIVGSNMSRPLEKDAGPQISLEKEETMTRFRNIAIVLCVISATIAVPILSSSAEEPKIPWSKVVAAPEMLKIWKDADARDLLAAKKVARHDAFRKLVSRIYGLKIDATTTILDLELEDEKIDASVEKELKGMKEVGWRYYEDGRCEVAVKVTIRQVVEVLTKVYKKYRTADKKTIENTTTRIKTFNKDVKLIEVGNGALKGSLGLKRIRARRVAELDLYTKLAGIVFGLNINSKTSVRDMALASDMIKSSLRNFLEVKGIRSTGIRYGDKICEVDGELTIRQVIEHIKRIQKRYLSGGKWKTLEYDSKDIEKRDTVIKATGEAPIIVKAASVTKRVITEGQIIEMILIKKEEKVIRKEIGALIGD